MKNSVILSWISVKKLFLPSLIAAISLFSPVKAQQYFFSDDFESYTAGEMLACQNPVDWTTWNLFPCSYEDAIVTDANALSGSNSCLVSNMNYEVKYWVPGTQDLWFIDFDCYIPSGNSGYFSTMASFIGTQEWGMEIYFHPDGTATLNAGGTGAFTFNFEFDTWVHSTVIIYLLFDEGNYYYNGEFVYQWQYSQGANGTPIPLLVSANGFYADQSSEMYIDNYSVLGVYWLPVELIAFSAAAEKPGGVALNWQTATETNNKGFDVERFGESLTGKWERIGFVEGKGTTTEMHSYSFTDNNAAGGCYLYRLKQIDFSGEFNYSYEIEIDLTAPAAFELRQNYPNPFNPTTQIKYSIPKDGFVSLKIYNTLGQQVASLENGFVKTGEHEITFDGSKLSSGVYYYRIESGDDILVKKMILMK